jgi:hypothetical protein
MDEFTIRQAIDLVHARRYNDARKLLRPVLEVNPTNEAAWIWFASAFLAPAERLIVLQMGFEYCPESAPISRGIAKCTEEIRVLTQKGEEPEPVDLTNSLPHLARKAIPHADKNIPLAGTPSLQWDQPIKKAYTLGSEPVKQEPPSSVDWMASLRQTMQDEEPAQSPFLQQEEPNQFPDPSPWADRLPQKQESKTPEIMPWEDMEEEEKTPAKVEIVQPPQIIKESRDPYRIPFFIASGFGIFLALILAVFVIGIMIQAGVI